MSFPSTLRCLFFCLCLLNAAAGFAQAAGGVLPDVRAAERELAAARHELEEIAGPRLLRKEAPPVPVVPTDLVLEPSGPSGQGTAWIQELSRVDPDEWSATDRRSIRELVSLDLDLRASLGGSGEEARPEELAPRLLPLLRATRVLALGDRLALLDGDLSAFLDGVELRERVAETLYRQGGILGPSFGASIHLDALDDLRRAVASPETGREALERIDIQLFRWRHEIPSTAQVAALNGLSVLERGESLPGQLGAGDDAAAALFLAPVAGDFAELARACLETSCAEAPDRLGRRREESGDPFRVVADLLMPNYLSFLAKLDSTAGLTEVARVAVALRLEASERGGYPSSLEDLPPALTAEVEAIEGLEYERVGGSARLLLRQSAAVSDWPEERRKALEPLLVWELPAPVVPEADGAR